MFRSTYTIYSCRTLIRNLMRSYSYLPLRSVISWLQQSCVTPQVTMTRRTGLLHFLILAAILLQICCYTISARKLVVPLFCISWDGMLMYTFSNWNYVSWQFRRRASHALWWKTEKLLFCWGDRGGTVVKVLCYKSEGRWFDPNWCHWNFSLKLTLWPWCQLSL